MWSVQKRGVEVHLALTEQAEKNEQEPQAADTASPPHLFLHIRLPPPHSPQ